MYRTQGYTSDSSVIVSNMVNSISTSQFYYTERSRPFLNVITDEWEGPNVGLKKKQPKNKKQKKTQL